jgi:hypothetical protein
MPEGLRGQEVRQERAPPGAEGVPRLPRPGRHPRGPLARPLRSQPPGPHQHGRRAARTARPGRPPVSSKPVRGRRTPARSFSSGFPVPQLLTPVFQAAPGAVGRSAVAPGKPQPAARRARQPLLLLGGQPCPGTRPALPLQSVTCPGRPLEQNPGSTADRMASASTRGRKPGGAAAGRAAGGSCPGEGIGRDCGP